MTLELEGVQVKSYLAWSRSNFQLMCDRIVLASHSNDYYGLERAETINRCPTIA